MTRNQEKQAHPRWLEIAKARIDNGLSRLGKSLDASHPVDRALMLLTARMVSVADAAALLCLRDHAAEAPPLSVALIGFAAEMREIARDSDEARARRFLDGEPVVLCGDPRWRAEFDWRLKSLGFQEELRDALRAWQIAFVRGGAGGLPWSHLFDARPAADAAERDWLEAAAISMGHALKALETRWPKAFPGAAEDLWSEIVRGRPQARPAFRQAGEQSRKENSP
jgi:hypothetical protein